MKTRLLIIALAANLANATFMLLLVCPAIPLMAQQTGTPENIVPSMVTFSGTLSNTDGKPLTGTVGVSFLLYKEQTGGAPLWLETQNVQADKNGHYSVMLGASTAHGLPADVFVAGEARWLGVQPSGQAEQPRTLLLSVPYALKALDAETVGGKPASAFLTASPSGTQGAQPATTPPPVVTYPIGCSSATACQLSHIPLFATNGGSATVHSSILTQSGSTITAKGSETVTANLSVGGNVSATTVTTTASTGGVKSTMTGTGSSIAAITGSATATGAAGFTFGVMGQSASNSGRGVFGLSTGNGGIGVIGENNNGPGIGVVGKALPGSSGYGVYGVAGNASSTGSHGVVAGVWGDSNTPEVEPNQLVSGVLGTADDAPAGIFYNNSSTGYSTLVAVGYGNKTYPFGAYNFGSGGGYCYISPSGDIDCSGSKNAVVPIDGGKRKVAMSAIESPANWFEDFGSAHLINGVAVVRLDPDFIQTVNTEKDYRVFPVPNGDCKGLYVTNKTPNSFEVRELGGGTSNVSFDYRITAIRRNYETVRFADHTNDPDARKMLEMMRAHRTKASSNSVMATPTPSPSAQSVVK